ncbi:MAG: hypothetical protein CR217_12885 [Beijerinckiaceae bacterium]|nr:MAG: hypothetical protein CR217_12885 [Beijerinckiaceae bacterium]
MKQRAGAGLHHGLEAGVARFLLGSVLASCAGLVKRASVGRGGLPSAVVFWRFSLMEGER